MKTYRNILLIIIVNIFVLETNAQNYSEQEYELLKGNSIYHIEFDLQLDKENQYVNIQSQIDTNICNSVLPIIGKFNLSESDTTELYIITEKYCDNVSNYARLPHVIESIKILINKNSDILASGEIVQFDSLKYITARKAYEFLSNQKNKYVSFEIIWDNKTPVDFRKSVIKQVINGYLNAANKYSDKLYGKRIYQLNNQELNTIRNRFQFVFLLVDLVPPPAPTIEEYIQENL